MRLFSAKVKEGALVPDEAMAPLPEGARVTVLADDEDETFDLSAEQETALLEAIREAEQGRVIPADEVLRRLAD